MIRTRCRRPQRAISAEPLESRRLFATVPSGFTDQAFGPSFASGTSMAFAPDGRLFALDQNGNVRVVQPDGVASTALTLSTSAIGERGLLGIAFDPAFANNGYVYLYYTNTTGGAHNRVSRFTVTGNTINAASETVIVDLENLSSATNHNGGALNFGPDGKLYVAVGNNADNAKSQSITSRFGKILRYNADGTIPADNPTSIAGLGTTTGIYRAIWAAGLRNPYTFNFDSATGKMFINDVGESTWEEINVGAAGANYGWAVTEGYFTATGANANYTNPFYTYQHGSGLQNGYAITGGVFYHSTGPLAFPAAFQNQYFFADYVSDWIGDLDPNGAAGQPQGTAPNFASNAGGTVDVDVGPDGALYYLSRDTIGAALQGVRRIVPNTAVSANLSLRTSGFATYGTSTTPATSLQYDGAIIATGDSTSQAYTVSSLAGVTHTVAAPVTQVVNGQSYVFQNWSDTGASTHSITTPALNTTLVATYRDVTAPAITAATFSRDPIAGAAPPQSLSFTTSEGVKAQSTVLTLVNHTSGVTTTINTLPSASSDARTFRYTFDSLFPGGVLPNGRYTATFGANGIKDLTGNANTAFNYDFTVLAGDVDSNGTVEFADLLTLAKNYGQSGKTFADGNVDGSADGLVDFADLLVLAKAYGTSLPSATAPDVALPSLTRKRGSASAGVIV